MVRALDPLQQLVAAADLRPARDERADDAGAAGVVGILIRVHLDAAIARLLDLLHERHRQAPARRPERLHVRHDAGQVAFFRDPNHFLYGADHADVVVGLVADVALVDTAHLADDLRHRDHFFGLRIAAGRVVQARRQADAPGFHAISGHRDHPVELGRGRCSIGHADDFATNGSMRNVQRDIHADASLLEAGALRPQIRRAAAVRVQRDRGDALRDQLARLLQESRGPGTHANARR